MTCRTHELTVAGGLHKIKPVKIPGRVGEGCMKPPSWQRRGEELLVAEVESQLLSGKWPLVGCHGSVGGLLLCTILKPLDFVS